MTTETLTVNLPVERTAVAIVPTATADETKSITAGCGMIILWDNRHNGNAVTITLSTRADIYGRTVEPAANNPITIAAGAMYVGGPYPSTLFGQGTSLNDLQYTIAVTSGGKLAVPGEVTATGATTGGSLGTADYDYKVTSVNANDLETDACAKVDANVASGSTGSVVVAWEAVAGACAYRIYGRTNGATLYLLHTMVCSPITDPAGTAMSWTDTGAIAESAIEPPAANGASDSKSFFFSAALNPTQTTL